MITLARQGETFSAYERFTIITCYKCGIPFGVPVHWQKKRREDKAFFWCPNGHDQHYATSEADRLRRKLDERNRQLATEQSRTADALRQRDTSRKSHRKMRERVKNGLCPCCNRTFQNLLAHLRTKHPEYGAQQTLRQVRETYGMTQGDLATEIGVQSAHVLSFERGGSVVTWARDQIEAWLENQAT